MTIQDIVDQILLYDHFKDDTFESIGIHLYDTFRYDQ